MAIQEREEEEHNYQLTINRQRDQDQYQDKRVGLEAELEEKKTAVEKDLAERKSIVKQREEKRERIEREIEKFPEQLRVEVGKAKAEVQSQLESKFKHEIDLFKKEVEGREELYKQAIQSLEAKLEEQRALVDALNLKSSNASKQVEQIAIRAIVGKARPLEQLHSPRYCQLI